jgi:MSHA biogenesis protein MshJ
MKALWLRCAAKLNALSLRERVLAWLAVSGVLAMLVWALAVDPAATLSKRASAQIETHNATLSAAEQQKTLLMARLAQRPDQPLLDRIAEIDQQIATIDQTLGDKSRSLVAPDRMTAVVKGMLQANAKLRLVSMRTIPARPLVEPKPESGANAQNEHAANANVVHVNGGIYKHGIELTVEGAYLDLMRYAEQLEALPTHLMWQRTRVDASEFPRVRMTLTLFTLSLEKTWLTL